MIKQIFIFLILPVLYYLFVIGFIYRPEEFLVYSDIRPRNNSKISDPSYELLCENNSSSVLYVKYGRYLVEAIYASYSSTTLQSISAGNDISNCSSITRHSLSYNNLSHAFSSAEERELYLTSNHHYSVGGLVFISCEKSLSPDLNPDIQASCTSTSEARYSYVLAWDRMVSDVRESCRIDMMVKMVPWGPMECNQNCSYPELETDEFKGIEIQWRADRCGVWEGSGEANNCWFDKPTNMVLCPYEEAKNSHYELLLIGELHG